MSLHKKLKVFGVPWHSAHQYSLAQMPFIERYDLIIEPYRRGFAETQRPMPETMHYVDHFKPSYYDFAILHVDQQCIYQPEKGDKISKGRLYMELNNLIKEKDPNLPIIVINHMTPFHDKYDSAFVVEYIKKIVGDNFMVVNSFEAAKQWGWGYPIIHGLDTEEWWDLPKEPRCIIVLSPAGMETAYRRIFARSVFRLLEDSNVPCEWVGMTKKFNNFGDYRDFLGRSLVFFNPTWQSPRPRSRTEAMLSGCCVVTTPYHDADSFIEDGVNGFLTSKVPIKDPRIMDNPQYTANLIKRLVLEEPQTAIKVGQAGKETARKLFNKDAFDNQWIELLTKLNILK